MVPFNKKDAPIDNDTKKKKTTCSGRVSVEKFKIMLAYVQIMALFRTNYSIRWPGSVRALFRLMDFFDFNLVQLVALECMHRSTYYFTFLVSLALPLGFAVLLFLLKQGGGKMKFALDKISYNSPFLYWLTLFLISNLQCAATKEN